MEQTVKVRSLLPDGRAEVIHLRQSACSGDCHQCAGCGAAQQTMVVPAENTIGARPGDLVVISSETSGVLKAAAVVYVLPMLLFFGGYALGAQMDMGAVLRGLCAGGTLGYGRRLWLCRIPAGARRSSMHGPPQEQKAENSIYDHRLCPPTGAQHIIEGGHWLGQKHDWIRPFRGNGERSVVYCADHAEPPGGGRIPERHAQHGAGIWRHR